MEISETLRRRLTAMRVVRIIFGVKTMSISDASAGLAATIDGVIADHEPVIIARQDAKACILLPLDAWESIDETAYLMSSQANAARLDSALRSFQTGEGVVTVDSTKLLGE